MESSNLAVPVYIDTNILLDLLASIEGGFSIVEKITTRSADAKTTELSGGTEFGVANILNLLKIDLQGSASRTKGQSTGEERQTERYHTYGSLLNRLRNSLAEAELITAVCDDESWQKASTSDFVELLGKFAPNPLLASLRTIKRLFGTTLLFGSFDMEFTKKPPQEKRQSKEQNRQIQEIQKVFAGLMQDLEQENIETFVIESKELVNHRIIVSLFTEYIRDRSGTELSGGEFRILGKVVRKIGEGESIDLIRGSGLSGFSEEILSTFLSGIQQAGKGTLKIPDLTTKIEAPAMQIIPIAVYI